MHHNWAATDVLCATSKVSDQPAHTHSLIRAFASHLNIIWVLSYWLPSFRVFKLKKGCRGSSESTLVKMPHVWCIDEGSDQNLNLSLCDKYRKFMFWFNLYLVYTLMCGSRGVSGRGVLWKITKLKGSLLILVQILWKITKLPSQHSMLGLHRPVSETSFKWRFAGGPMMARC